MVSERRWLWAIFALYFLLGIGYSLLMPLWEAPDEPAHYHLAWRVARRGEYATVDLNYEANQPRTFYYLGSYVIRALDGLDTKYSDYFFPREFKANIRVPERRFDWNDGNYRFLLGVYALRWMNLSFGALALWLNWKTFKLIGAYKPTLQLSALALAALTPQYLHITSSVNNDGLGIVAGALLFYLAVRILNDLSPLLQGASVFLAVLLPFGTKLTVLPVSAAVLILIASKWLRTLRQKRMLILSGIAIVLMGGILVIVLTKFFPSALSEIQWRLFSFRDNAWTWNYIKFISSQILATYWGQVGWLAVGLPNWIINSLTALGLTGVALQVYKRIKTKSADPQMNLWRATLLVASFTILAVARNALTTRGTQGRLLFPAIVALSLLMVSGWHDALPEKVQQRLPLIVTAVMLVLNLWLWIFGIIPVYYQPFLD